MIRWNLYGFDINDVLQYNHALPRGLWPFVGRMIDVPYLDPLDETNAGEHELMESEANALRRVMGQDCHLDDIESWFVGATESAE